MVKTTDIWLPENITFRQFNEMLNNDAALAFAFLNGLAWLKRCESKIFIRIKEGDEIEKMQ